MKDTCENVHLTTSSLTLRQTAITLVRYNTASYLANKAMPLRKISYESRLSQLVLCCPVRGEYHVSAAIGATFRWQCCPPHRRWLQACTVGEVTQKPSSHP